MTSHALFVGKLLKLASHFSKLIHAVLNLFISKSSIEPPKTTGVKI